MVAGKEAGFSTRSMTLIAGLPLAGRHPPATLRGVWPMLDNIPEELRKRSQWVVWKDGKIPYTPGTQDKASSTDPATWRSFQEAKHALGNGGGFKGVGFVFSPDDPYVGVDLDECVNGNGFSIASHQIVDGLSSYTEYSPSGEGGPCHRQGTVAWRWETCRQGRS